MSNCPSCGTQVNVDFGMATCPSCSLVFMVGIDGTAQMPDASDYSSDEAPATETPDFQEAIDSANRENEPAPLESNFEGTEIAPTYVGTDLPQDEDLDFSGGATEIHTEVYGAHDPAQPTEADYLEPTEIYQRPEAEDSEYDENFLTNGFGNDPEFDNQDDPPPADDPKDPVGIQKFDGNPASQLGDGPYYYDLYISGLDTAQIKDQVMKALTDKRFQWRHEDIKAKLRNGRLIFKDLNPVKAVLIVIKLQHIDVEIQWIQKLHTDPSVTGGTPGQI